MPNGREKGDRKSKKVFRSSRKSTSQSGGGFVHLVLASDYTAVELNSASKKTAVDALKSELFTAFKAIDRTITSIVLTQFTAASTPGSVQIDVTVNPGSVSTTGNRFSTSVSSINTAFNKILKRPATPFL